MSAKPAVEVEYAQHVSLGQALLSAAAAFSVMLIVNVFSGTL